MATNYNNDKIVSYAGDVNTAPDKYTTLTGTITTVGRIATGTGTLWLTEIGGGLSTIGSPTIVAGGWIFNGTDEVRQIKEVISDTSLILEQGFTANLTGAACKFVQDSRVKQMSFVDVSGTVTVDGVAVILAEGSGWGDTANNNRYVLSPVVIDSTGGTLHLTKMTAN